jgi:hypothetical protein
MFWARTKSLAGGLAAVVLSVFPALTTYFAFETVRTIYRSEQQRHEAERLRLTYEALYRYVAYEQSSPTFAPCSAALLQMDDEDIRALLQYPTRAVRVKYEEVTHEPLVRCLAPDNIMPPANGEFWTIPTENTLRKRNLSELDHLDALLIIYRNDAPSKPVICENVRGLMVIRNKDDRPLRFLAKLLELDILLEYSYPNLVGFLDEFMKERRCPAAAPPRQRELVLLEWLGLLRK